MKLTTASLATAIFAVALAGCSKSPGSSQATSSAERPSMPAEQAASAAAEHMAEGTLNTVDTTAGTVNISHGPVASAGWPAMTMSFKLADPRAAADLKPGAHVKFQFTIQSAMSATVTQISASE